MHVKNVCASLCSCWGHCSKHAHLVVITDIFINEITVLFYSDYNEEI